MLGAGGGWSKAWFDAPATGPHKSVWTLALIRGTGFGRSSHSPNMKGAEFGCPPAGWCLAKIPNLIPVSIVRVVCQMPFPEGEEEGREEPAVAMCEEGGGWSDLFHHCIHSSSVHW